MATILSTMFFFVDVACKFLSKRQIYEWMCSIRPNADEVFMGDPVDAVFVDYEDFALNYRDFTLQCD